MFDMFKAKKENLYETIILLSILFILYVEKKIKNA